MLNREEIESYDVSILFVDDESSILSSLKRMLKSSKYTLFTALSGSEGLEILKKNDIQIVVSDMRMPEMFGDEFLELVANNYPDTIRILLTSYSDLASAINAINKGKIYCYISKPWDDYNLKMIISQAAKHILLNEEKEHLEEVTKRQNELLSTFNADLRGKIQDKTKELEESLNEVRKVKDKIKNNFVNFVKVISSLIEMRDPRIVGHSREVGRLAYQFALHLELGTKKAQDLLFAGLLHDIGKICLSDKLLTADPNQLSESDKEIINKLPHDVCDTLMGLDYLKDCVEYIKMYQTRYDGVESSDGIKGDSIPLGSRVLIIVNDYEDIIQGRLKEKGGYDIDWKNYLKSHKGTKFDPELVEEYIQFIEGKNNSVSAEPQKEKEKQLKSHELKKGMILERDVLSETGLILLPQGFEFDSDAIENIKLYEMKSKETLAYTIRV